MFTLAVETIILDYLKESLITEDFVKKFQVLYVKFFRLAKHILQPQTSKFRLTLRIWGRPGGSPLSRLVEIFEKLAAAPQKPAFLSEAAHT